MGSLERFRLVLSLSLLFAGVGLLRDLNAESDVAPDVVALEGGYACSYQSETEHSTLGVFDQEGEFIRVQKPGKKQRALRKKIRMLNRKQRKLRVLLSSAAGLNNIRKTTRFERKLERLLAKLERKESALLDLNRAIEECQEYEGQDPEAPHLPSEESSPTPNPTASPSPTPEASPTPTSSPTPDETPTPTPDLPPVIEASQENLILTFTQNEGADRRIIIRPLSGTVEFSSQSIVGDSELSLLTPSEVVAQGGIPCIGEIERFCEIILRTKTDQTGTFAAVMQIQARPTSHGEPGGEIRTTSLSASVVVQSETLDRANEFRVVQVGAKAAQLGMSVKNLLLSELDSVRPNSYLADDRPTFQSYNPIGFSEWSQSWFNGAFDFSGIAWDAHEAGTAITRCHIVIADHFERSGAVRFHRKDGTVFQTATAERRALADFGINRDVVVMRIDPCLPSDFTVYPLLDGAEGLSSQLVGAPLINTHYPFGNIRAISARVVGYVGTYLGGGPLRYSRQRSKAML